MSEPYWFKKKEPYAPSGKWSLNKVDIQSKEWEAFTDACKTDIDSAMESTSIGLGQIMGFHWKRLGFNCVQDMWVDANYGEENQLNQILKFIQTDKHLFNAVASQDWDKVATIYNGAGYKKLAEKLGREPYDLSLEKAFNRYKLI